MRRGGVNFRPMPHFKANVFKLLAALTLLFTALPASAAETFDVWPEAALDWLRKIRILKAR